MYPLKVAFAMTFARTVLQKLYMPGVALTATQRFRLYMEIMS